MRQIASLSYNLITEWAGECAVDFLIEVFWALLMVGVPTAAFTTALVWWALQREFLKESSDAKALGREIKAQ